MIGCWQSAKPVWRIVAAAVTCAPAMVALAGCGGATDLGSSQRSSAFDSGLTGNYSGYGTNAGFGAGAGRQEPTAPQAVYPHIEASFELPDIKGDPFDFSQNDVQVTFTRPDGQSVRIPAFYDGGTTWRARYTPTMPGHYTVTGFALNRTPVNPAKAGKREFEVTGDEKPGFVRRDPRSHTRFVLDGGTTFYPIGVNAAWGEVIPTVQKVGAAGGNWARVWMCHWGGTNLDWVTGGKIEPGKLDLMVAKRWDEIVSTAEQSGVRLQVVLQHHGQYSTRVNQNWSENPWNKANGGWLSTPDEFFTDSRARELTRRKYRYIVARWGYSPAIMAWELFNEVEWTDACFHKHYAEVAAWHREMAEFLRQQDPNHHLVTSSSDTTMPGIFDAVDYLQPHSYPPDIVTAATALDSRKADRPIFFGEIGAGDNPPEGLANALHDALWGSLASSSSGTAQYWDWEAISKGNLFQSIESVSEFVRKSGFASRSGLTPASAAVSGAGRGPLSFGPSGGWTRAQRNSWTVPTSGSLGELAAMPSFLQGTAHKDLFSQAAFQVTYAEPGEFEVTIGQVARAGARVVLHVPGGATAEKAFAASGADHASTETIRVAVPAGSHTVQLSNTGADWVVIRAITLTPYAPGLAVYGKSTRDYAVLWVRNRKAHTEASALHGARLDLPGMHSGEYVATWWDTHAGKQISEQTITASAAGALTVPVPDIARDAAVWVTRKGTAPKPAKQTTQVRPARAGTPALRP